MSYPISELIVQNVESTLSGVTIGAGYENTLTVEREKQPFNSPRNRLAVVMPAKMRPQTPAPLGLDEYILPIAVVFYVIQAESNEDAISQALYSIAADVRKALMVDVHRNGHAVNTEFDPDDIFNSSKPSSGAVVANIRFRTLRGNPYQR